MQNVNRWGLAAGLAAALALYGNAHAQGSGGGGAAGASPSTSTGSASQRDTTPGSTAGQPGSATGSRDPSAPPQAGSGSATGSGAATGSTGSATGAGTAKAGQKVDEDLQKKLQKIHASNQAELQMAKVAQQQAQSPNVKQFAQQLEQDHQRLDEKLTQTAQSMGVTLQGKEFQKAQEDSRKDVEKLSKKTGAEFDKAFMEAMVDDHEKDVKAVKSAAEDAREGNHTELASLLEQAQTGMQGHLSHAEQIQQSLERQAQERRRAETGKPGATGTGSAGQSGTGAGGPGPGSSGQQGTPAR